MVKYLWIVGISSLLFLSSLLFSCVEEKQKNNPHKAPIEGFFEGMELYNTKCSLCHQKTGIPELDVFPPLKDADYLRDNQDKIACIIQNGLSTPTVVNGKQYKVKMNGFEELSAQEISQIINYINNAWGNEYGTTTTQKVKEDLRSCK